MTAHNDEHDVRHESTDVEPRAILRLAIIGGVVVVGSIIAIVPLFTFYDRREARQDAAPAPLAPQERGRAFPAPRLQEQPFVDIKQLRAEEQRLLDNYGWVDEKNGVVRIPIEEAMRLLAERGLPVRGAQAPAPEVAGASAPRRSSGGTQ